MHQTTKASTGSEGSFSFSNRQYIFQSKQNSFTAQLNSKLWRKYLQRGPLRLYPHSG
jgi:hypothetical protein